MVNEVPGTNLVVSLAAVAVIFIIGGDGGEEDLP